MISRRRWIDIRKNRVHLWVLCFVGFCFNLQRRREEKQKKIGRVKTRKSHATTRSVLQRKRTLGAFVRKCMSMTKEPILVYAATCYQNIGCGLLRIALSSANIGKYYSPAFLKTDSTLATFWILIQVEIKNCIN